MTTDIVLTLAKGRRAMIFGNRIYGHRVLARVQALAREVHAGEDLSDCIGVFATVNTSLTDRGDLDLKTVFKNYRKRGFSVNEGAISVIDGTVSALKEAAKRIDAKETVRPIALLEALIDRAMRDPPRFIPRNGKFADVGKHFFRE